MSPGGDRHETGLRALEALGGPDAAAPILAAADIAPDLVRFAIDFAFGEVLSRPGLDVRTRELCTVAALSVLGHAAPQLKWHAEAALHVGAQQAEVDEMRRIARVYLRPDGGGVTGQGPLDPVTRELAAVALLTAIGTQPAALKHHLRAALAAGATRAQVVLVLEQMAIYAGFPAALNGVAAAREVFAESA
ncbi:MAG TPA: carboxymuconolactone decarboxylase family protein [Vicinamibacterales bacterium]|nr:carboxymuconolactone decarboxylase family protein [Vicinamibacterales bacterium]